MDLFSLFCVFVFAFCDVCFLQTCGHLLGKADLFALLYVIFSSAFYTFPYSVLGPVWYLIVSVPDLCLLPYFVLKKNRKKDNARTLARAHTYIDTSK